jgi:hypothetical protein
MLGSKKRSEVRLGNKAWVQCARLFVMPRRQANAWWAVSFAIARDIKRKKMAGEPQLEHDASDRV